MLGQHRSTQRKVPCGADDEEALTEDIIALARQYGRYGYRRVTALLHAAGWSVNHKRVERIWRREGLKVPQRQPKRGRLWLNDGSCIRLRPEYPGHVWAYDFVEARTHDGRKFRILTIIDEASRECLALVVARRLRHEDVLAALAEGSVRNFVCGRAAEHYAAMALMKRSPKMTANCALAMVHSRGGILHSFSDRFKIR